MKRPSAPAEESSTGREPLVHPNTQLGERVTLEPYVVLGAPPRGTRPGELPLVIGDDAHIRSHTVIYAGNVIGRRFETGHGVLVRESNEIGDDVSVGSHSIVEHHVRIGDGCRIHSNAFIPEYTTLEAGAWVGPNVVLTNAVYPLARGAKENLRGPLVRERAKIGANATVLPGVIVGRNALVGAGSVVVEDVADGKIVAGNPARVLRDVADVADYGEGE